MSAEILTERHGNSVVISFNRPEHANRLTTEMANQLFNYLKNVTTNIGIRAVLLRGQGGNFMGGLDLRLYNGAYDAAVSTANQMMQPYHAAIREINVMDKPVLAAVEGRVEGPGMSFMLACDLVLAARNSVFNMAFTRYALSPDGGASHCLTRKIGAAKAMELMMLSEDVNAETALKLGLINGIADDDKVHTESMAWADKLSNGPTKAFAAVKKLVGKAYQQDLVTHLSLEHNYWGACTRSFDFRDVIKSEFDPARSRFSGA